MDIDAVGRTPVVHEGRVLVSVSHRGTVAPGRGAVRRRRGPAADLPVLSDPDGVVSSFAAHGPASSPSCPLWTTQARSYCSARTAMTDVNAELRASGLQPAGGDRHHRAGRLPGARFRRAAGGPGPHPVLLHVHGGPFAQHVRGLLRRGAGVRVGRIRGRAAATRAAPPVTARRTAKPWSTGDGHGRRRRRARAARRGTGTARLRRRPGRRDGRLLRRLHDRLAGLAPPGPVRGGLVASARSTAGSRSTAPPTSAGTSSSRTSAPIPRRSASCEPVDLRRQDHHAVHGRPLRTGLALPAGTGAAACTSRCAPTACTTQFLLFPGEGHELSRSGKPAHRVQRLRAVLDWWSKWLPV